MLYAISVGLRHTAEELPTLLKDRCPIHLDNGLFCIFISLAVTHIDDCINFQSFARNAPTEVLEGAGGPSSVGKVALLGDCS